MKDIIFCFTGKGPMSRNELTAIAIKAGASVSKSVTNTTTTLVISDMDSQSVKAKKARSLGIDLIGPQTFLAMCKAQNITSFASALYFKQKVNKEIRIIEEQVKKPLVRKIILD